MVIQQFLLMLLYLVSPLTKGFYKFTIKDGRHRSSGLKTWAINSDSVEFRVKFSSNANQYVIENPEQINKAFGLKKGIRGNRNSAMLGYNTTLDENGKLKFNLHLFVNESDGRFHSIPLEGDFSAGVWYDVYLCLYTDYALLGIERNEFTDTATHYYKDAIQTSCLGVIRPWFGGKQPNDMGDIKIEIEIL